MILFFSLGKTPKLLIANHNIDNINNTKKEVKLYGNKSLWTFVSLFCLKIKIISSSGSPAVA